MKLACDDNLGKLAKNLRLLGFDTFFAETIADSELLAVAAAQGRYLLTRDNGLQGRSHPFGMLLLEDDDPRAQLAAVVKALDLKIKTVDLFRRCSRCNTPCRPVTKMEIAERAFPYIIKTHDIINECPSCRRLYWKGTHYHRILAGLKSAIPPENIIGEWPES